MSACSPVEASPNRVRLRVADVQLLDRQGTFDGYGKVELIEGGLLYVNAQWRRHMTVRSGLSYRIRVALEAAGSDLFVGIEGSVALTEHDLPQPDILLTDAAAGDGPVPGASIALLVEVSDTTLAFDLGPKARIYAAAGVPEYWVVDVNEGVVHVLSRPEGFGYRNARRVSFGDEVCADTVPNLAINTGRL